MPERFYDAVVIGGGFFGCCVATYLKQYAERVVLLERGGDLLERASYANQARVHNGYHYPRSILTALRSRINYPRFIRDYPGCIVRDFDKYYAVGRLYSKVTASQYERFFERVGAPLEPAPEEVRGLFNSHLIEEVWRVVECAFDPVALRAICREQLRGSQVEVRLNTRAAALEQGRGGRIEVIVANAESGQPERLICRHVLNCTYSQINSILAASSLPLIALKHELTEMALVEHEEPLRGLGITVMCGPFFSTMPFPPRGLHTVSHVRYTPHKWWQDEGADSYMDAYSYFDRNPQRSRYPHMQRDISRYLPAIEGSRQVGSIWEVKTVLPQSEVDDSRPILFQHDWGIKNLTCIMGGKIDNIYDVLDELESLRERGRIL